MAANQFRYTIGARAGAQQRFSGARGASNDDFGIVGICRRPAARHLPVQHDLEQELPGDMGLRVSYIGSTMRSCS